jgi:outer membrane protein insertion porin family
MHPIRVVGNATLTRDELAPALGAIERMRFAVPTIAKVYVLAAMESTNELVRETYVDRGFEDVVIRTGDTVPSADGRFVDVTLNVSEGVRFRVGDLTVEEQRDGSVAPSPHAELRTLIPLAKGDWWSRAAMLRGFDALLASDSARGLGLNEVSPTTSVVGDVINMRFVIRRGLPAKRIVAVKIDGMATEDEPAVRDALAVKVGMPLSELEERAARRRVLALPFVAAVDVVYHLPSDDTGPTLEVEVIAASQPVRPRGEPSARASGSP